MRKANRRGAGPDGWAAGVVERDDADHVAFFGLFSQAPGVPHRSTAEPAMGGEAEGGGCFQLETPGLLLGRCARTALLIAGGPSGQ